MTIRLAALPRTLIAALGVAALALGAAARAGTGGLRPPDAPPTLAATGLYGDAAALQVAPANLPFSPQYPLWSDGADKRRWIYLPPGTSIDASDPERWRFPVGTKLWKEFAWKGRRVETRYLLRTRAGWSYATYVWDAAGKAAALAPATGLVSDQEVAPGRRHVIPGVADCKNCHQGGRSEVLGFGALQLSPDRDPLAPHAEPLPAGAVTLDALARRGLVRGLPRSMLEHPPRIEAATPRGRAALGYLHANCGGCHDSEGPLASVGLTLRHVLSARSPSSEPAALAIGHSSRVAAPGVAPADSFWIAPGAPARSTVATRMASRSPVNQMPPLGSLVVDEQAVALVTAWIRDDLAISPPSHAQEEPKK